MYTTGNFNYVTVFKTPDIIKRYYLDGITKINVVPSCNRDLSTISEICFNKNTEITLRSRCTKHYSGIWRNYIKPNWNICLHQQPALVSIVSLTPDLAFPLPFIVYDVSYFNVILRVCWFNLCYHMNLICDVECYLDFLFSRYTSVA